MSYVWRLDAVVFDEARGVLTVDGEPVEVDRSCRAILAMLLAEAGRTVSKERLLQAGWPNRIVHENSLAKAIGRLRDALGEQGKAITTVYGHGYTLKAEPEAVDIAGPPVAGERDAHRGKRGRLQLYGAALLVVTASVGLGAWALRAPGSEEAQFRRAAPITNDAPDAIGSLLWVDDNPENNAFEERFFKRHRIAVHIATNTADALKLLSINNYKLVISDLGRSDDRLAGLKLVEAMREHGDERPVFIYTVRPIGAAAQQAQRSLVIESGAQGLAVTPEEIRKMVLARFGNPPRIEDD